MKHVQERTLKKIERVKDDLEFIDDLKVDRNKR